MAYLLFVYMDFTAGGGWNDYRGKFAELDKARSEAIDVLQGGGCAEAHIVDLDTERVVLDLYAFRDSQGFAIREETLERIVN